MSGPDKGHVGTRRLAARHLFHGLLWGLLSLSAIGLGGRYWPSPASSEEGRGGEDSRATALPLSQPRPFPSALASAPPPGTASPRPARPVPGSQLTRLPGAEPTLSAAMPAAAVSSTPPAPFTSLPPASEELLADGLPASGIRCRIKDGVPDCGECRTDGDCPVGKGCVPDRTTRQFQCQESECEEDAHCFPGSVCRAVTTGATSALVVRRCVPEGVRGEGETCDTMPLSRQGTCREGVRCVQGQCGRPCQPGEPGTCPEGSFCEEGQDGAACYSDCTQRGCPASQQCKAIGEGLSKCLVEVKGSCPEEPCGEGERCNRRVYRDRGLFWCGRICQPLQPGSCGEGEVCGMGGTTVSTCYRRCDLSDPDTCGANEDCVSISEDLTLWGCRPHLDY